MVVQGGAGWCAAVCGGVRWCAVVCGGVRWCAVVCGGAGWCAVVCGGVRWCAVVRKYVLIHLRCREPRSAAGRERYSYSWDPDP